MAQFATWEEEYQNPKLVTTKAEPQNDTLRFFKYLKKEAKIKLNNLKILDLGSGTGRNSNYLAQLGNLVVGLEISDTAVEIATKRAEQMNIKEQVKYLKQSIGSSYPFADEYFDLVLDVISSNSLNEKERSVYLKEVYRVLKVGGNFFVRTLCKDGDKNAKNLLKINPSVEYDTYSIKELDLTERVFSEADFRKVYGEYFKIKKLAKKSGYTRFMGQNYKRNYWLAYLQKVKT
ncbi:MAG: class I SAM-dependent methyltransferase [Patescibacteria group bacterium]|jgi:SAM-dependent methyltransferase